MKVTKQTITAQCPDCEHEIILENIPTLGQKVTCPECWAYLEVTNLKPLELAWETDLVEDDGYGDGEGDEDEDR